MRIAERSPGDEPDFVASAPALPARSDRAGISQLACHGAMLGLSGTAVFACAGSAWVVVAMLVHGIVLVFLFAPLHECIHRSAFATRWLNDVVACVCGAVLVLPPGYFRAFHLTHHRHTQDPQRDPELARQKPASWRSYLLHVSGLPYWLERIGTIARHAAGDVDEAFIDERARREIRREARLLLGCYGVLAAASVASGSGALIDLWLLPALLGQPFLRLFLLAEHWGCPLVPDMRKNARTTRSNALVRRLAWNMPYHTAHHVSPGVPFHALPAYHARIAASVQNESSGYLAVQREMTSRFSPGTREHV